MGYYRPDNRAYKADFRNRLNLTEEGKVMEIIQRILEAYFEYVRFILEHIFWFIPK